MSKKNIILDATTLTSVMTCGRFTDLRFNLQLQSAQGKSNSLEVGSLVHKVLETFYRGMTNRLKRDDAIGFALTAGELYVTGCPTCTGFEPTEENPIPECKHPPNEYPGVMNTPPDSTNQPSRVGWKDALKTCEEYFDFYKGDFWVPLEVETVKKEVLYEDEEIRILWKAKLDLTVDTNQEILPVDHKTMKQRRDTISLNNQFMGQCILMGSSKVVINKIGFQKTLKADEKFTRVMMPYSSDRLAEWRTEILPYWAYEMLKYTESEYWPPNFTQCEGKFGPCMFVDVCSANRNMREETLKQNFIVGPKWDIENVEE